jgi:hypothetical protein
MKTKVIETHWEENPVISRINGEIERDCIPLVKRVLYARFWPFWIPIKTQIIRKDLNEYILVATMGGLLTYDKYWHPDLLKVDKTIRL